MQRTLNLKKSYHFRRVYRKAEYISSRHLTLYYLKRRDKQNFLGVAVRRKLKGSVRRNRVKRWLRELYLHQEIQIKVGFDFILLGRCEPENTTYRQLEGEWLKLLQQAELLE